MAEPLGEGAGSRAVDMGCFASSEPPAPRHPVTYVDGVAGDDGLDGTTPGSPKKTISGALAVTAPGGVCHVASGVYAEEVLMPYENQSLLGAGAETTTVLCPGDTAVSLLAPGQLVRGFTLTGGLRGALVDDNAVSGGRIDLCTISGNKFGVFAGSSSTPCEEVTISRCRVVENSHCGVYMRGISLPNIVDYKVCSLKA